MPRRAAHPGPTVALLSLALAALVACGSGGGETPGSPAAAITTQPADRSVVEGTSATFGVVASNATGYQWERSAGGGASFAAVAGATGSSYTTPATTLADGGTRYRVVVSGAGAGVTSSAATLTVTAAVVAPSIAVHPASRTVTAGQDASFSVTASGTSLAYQWQRSTDGGTTFGDVAGETLATLTLTAVTQADGGQQLRVVVSNGAGRVTSDAAVLTVEPAPVAPAFTTEPASLAVLAPDAATFTAVATGTPAPTLQWQLSTDGGASFADIAGATGESYTTAATVAGDDGNRYRAVATSPAGSATSAVAVLTVTVLSAPSFTQEPVDLTLTEGQSGRFTVAVTGTPTPTLQWQLSTDLGASWSDIVGATGTALDLVAPSIANDGRRFRCLAVNHAGSTYSTEVALAVVPRSWKTSVTLSAGDAGDPQVAMDGRGNARVVWHEWDGARNNVWTNDYTDATDTWGTPVTIETDAGSAEGPQLAVDPGGNAWAVWAQDDDPTAGLRFDLWANQYTQGVGWGTAARISTAAGFVQGHRVVVDAGGNALAVWSELSGPTMSIWANRYTAGVGWGTAELLETDDTGVAGSPQLAVDGGGNALAVWYQGDGTSDSIWANRYTAGVGWGTAELVEAGAGNAWGPQIAFDPGGNAWAAWAQASGTIYSVWANRYVPGSGWGTAELIETDDAGSAEAPRIAIDADGNTFAVWSQSSGTINDIWANRFVVGAGWEVPTRLETDNGSFADFPRIALDRSGNVMAVWKQYRPVAFNRYVAGTGWGTAGRVDPNPNNDVTGAPEIAVAPGGNALAVWRQWVGPSAVVMANRFR